MNSTRRCLPLAALGFVAGSLAALPVAGQPAGLWDQLRGLVEEEGEQLEQLIDAQAQVDADDQNLERQLEAGRRLRQMHREAVLLSRLNVAWIFDQLDGWDCRMADRKQQEARLRIEELNGFGARVTALCTSVGATDGAQQRVCREQRSELEGARAELEQLARRYAGQCARDSGQSQ